MAIGRAILLGLFPLAALLAQTFPADYRTDDATVVSRLKYLFERMAGEHASLAQEYRRLVALPANRVYRQLDAQARAAALQAALPLVKQVAMSESVQKAHDEHVARQYGAIDHGLKLALRRNPATRFREMSTEMQKNPAVLQKQGFMEQFMKVQQDAAEDGLYNQELRVFAMPMADLRSKFNNDRESASGNARAKKCYDEAAPLADSNPDRFRLAAYRCSLVAYGVDKPEAEVDRIRIQRAQWLYDEFGMKGVIRRILTEFLETAPAVDYTAQTAAKGGRQVFVNPEYEKKNGLWKLIYRNGKEPTEVTVQFAKAWLTELAPPAPEPSPALSATGPASAVKAAPAKAAPRK